MLSRQDSKARGLRVPRRDSRSDHYFDPVRMEGKEGKVQFQWAMMVKPGGQGTTTAGSTRIAMLNQLSPALRVTLLIPRIL